MKCCNLCRQHRWKGLSFTNFCTYNATSFFQSLESNLGHVPIYKRSKKPNFKDYGNKVSNMAWLTIPDDVAAEYCTVAVNVFKMALFHAGSVIFACVLFVAP